MLAGLLAVLVTVGGFPPRAAGAQTTDLTDDIATKQAEAARIADEVEELGRQASIAVEAYRQAQSGLAEADAHLFEIRGRVEELRREYEATQTDANERILAMYRGESTPNPMTYLDARDAQELGVRQHYAGLVAQRDRTTLDRLVGRRQALDEQEAELERQRDEVATQTEAVKAERDRVEGAAAGRQTALDQAQGELNGLVAEEQRRRAAAEEARAREAARQRAEAEAAAARERAARLAATSTTLAGAPTPTSLPDAEPEPAAADVPPPHPRAGEAVQAAMDKIGTPYQWGGNGPDSYDCSGLTTYAWGSVGVRLPRSSSMQKAALPPVPIEALQPGDLVFFGSPVHHVGMFIGDGKMVNAPYSGDSVRVDSIYRRDYAGAGRPG